MNPGDKLIIYQEEYNQNFILKVLHNEQVADIWILKKSKSHLYNQNTNSDVRLNNNSNNLDYNPNNGFEKDNKIKTESMVHTKEEKEKDRYDLRYKENTLYNIPILLVDDEQDMLSTFDFFLKNEGYKNVKAFSDPKNVLRYILDLKDSLYYKLAIIDIRMPGINGIQLYPILKILNPSIKIIFLTALDSVNELTSLYPEINPIDIMRKPIDPNQFIKTVSDKVLSIGIQ